MTMIGLWIFKENENANKSEIKKILNSQSRLILREILVKMIS